MQDEREIQMDGFTDQNTQFNELRDQETQAL